MSEIESVKPVLTIVSDDGDFIINSTGPIGKAMAQSVLSLLASARRIMIVTDGEMRVMKRNGAGVEANGKTPAPPARRSASPMVGSTMVGNSSPDIQDQFTNDLEAGVTGEQATGEAPSPTPGPSDPVKISARRKPQIFQDAAAPPAPELVEAEMARLLAEAEQAEAEEARAVEDQRFQRQQAVQAQVEEAPAEEPAAAKPRKREPRQLATSGRPCGRCGGGGRVQGEAGFVGACPVCHGGGQVKTWDRSLKVR